MENNNTGLIILCCCTGLFTVFGFAAIFFMIRFWKRSSPTKPQQVDVGKRQRTEVATSNLINQQVIATNTKSIAINGYNLVIPERMAKLLYISDKDSSGALFEMKISVVLEPIDGKAKVATNFSTNDPSVIFTRMPVRQPHNVEAVPSPDYYPTYAGLTPEQKWIYLNWLTHLSEPIHSGYLFIYYYGLERQLLLGDFDLAFEEILFLRRYHQNKSFLTYSGSALLHSCIFRKQLDKFENLQQMVELGGLGNAELLITYRLGSDLTAKGLMAISKNIKGINQRYLKNDEARFQMVLEECLHAKYGDTYFPFASHYQLSDLPKQRDVLFANVSFPSDVRSPEWPSFLVYAPFTNEVSAIFAEAHEQVKALLKEERQRKR
ncbi:MAG: hypothetical protein GY797_16750 [Deltaproteobacteria bacterium]|nr:hypothetical protein [Deltaproteobacteria bacterium]